MTDRIASANITSIVIFGKTYSLPLQIPEVESELQNRFGSSQWISDLSMFLKEWYNVNDYILTKTSGTTGQAKTIQLSKSSMISSARKTNQYFNLTQKTAVGLVLPTKFIAGKMMIVRALAGKLDLYPYPPSIPFSMELQQSVDFIALVPNQLDAFLERVKVSNRKIKVLLGGAPLSKSQIASIANSNMEAYQSYASTETASHVALRRIGTKTELPYEALTGVHFSIDHRNCLVIHNDYLDSPTLITNDVVELIDSSHFFWLGRADNIINSAGIKINPETAEVKISHLIDAPYFIGKQKDPKWGESAILYIEGKNTEEHKQQLLEKIKNVLGKLYAPKQIRNMDKIPRTESGKIIRNLE